MLGIGPTLPAGWTAEPYKGHDSGPGATAPAPSLVNADNCDYLTSQGIDVATGLNVASATEPLSLGKQFAVAALYAYKPGDAAKSLAQVRQNIASGCDSFRASSNGIMVRVNVSAAPVAGLGDEALLVKVVPQGAYVEQENLVVRRGDLVASLWSNNVFGGFPDLTPVATAIVAGMG